MASHGVPRTAAAATRTEQSRRQEQAEIEKYRELTEQVNKKIVDKDFSLEVLHLTSDLLSKNPEYYTIWNYRRLVLLKLFNNQQEEITTDGSETTETLLSRQKIIENLIVSDLRFQIPLLRKHPKCYWLWNHRNWLLQQAQSHLPVVVTLKQWQIELGLVGKMLSLDSRNFHGWGYRRTIIAKIEELQDTSLAETEFQYTTKVIQTNLSNFSAWHYRGNLIPRLLADRGAADTERRKMLDDEFEFIKRGLWTDPYDQSLWGYHQFLMKIVTSTSKEESFVADFTNADRLKLLEREIEATKEMLEGAEDCKWTYVALLQYSQMYLELDAGNKLFTTQELRNWLDELKKLDSLRAGRWNDLEKKLNL